MSGYLEKNHHYLIPATLGFFLNIKIHEIFRHLGRMVIRIRKTENYLWKTSNFIHEDMQLKFGSQPSGHGTPGPQLEPEHIGDKNSF